MKTNAERLRDYKQRKRKRGAARLDVWLSPAAMRKLRELKTPFDSSLGRTLERVLMRYRSAKNNFREALNYAINRNSGL